MAACLSAHKVSPFKRSQSAWVRVHADGSVFIPERELMIKRSHSGQLGLSMQTFHFVFLGRIFSKYVNSTNRNCIIHTDTERNSYFFYKVFIQYYQCVYVYVCEMCVCACVFTCMHECIPEFSVEVREQFVGEAVLFFPMGAWDLSQVTRLCSSQGSHLTRLYIFFSLSSFFRPLSPSFFWSLLSFCRRLLLHSSGSPWKSLCRLDCL